MSNTLVCNGLKCKCLMKLRPAVFELQFNVRTDIPSSFIVIFEGRLDNFD